MLRLTELKLPLDHDEGALRAAVLHRLALAPDNLVGFRIWRRSWDARKRSDIQLIYTIDVEVRNDQAILKRFKGDHNIGPAPDTTYKPVAKAPAAMTSRPIVIGFGPCGFFAGWCWRRWACGRSCWSAARRARAHQGHLGAVAQAVLQPEVERAVRRRRRGHLLRRQALQPDQGPASSTAAR